MSRDNEIILDLHQALQKILNFTQGMSKEEFKAQNSQVPFAQIRGMRNRVVHEYSEVDQIVVWEAIQTHIPELLNSISSLIP